MDAITNANQVVNEFGRQTVGAEVSNPNALLAANPVRPLTSQDQRSILRGAQIAANALLGAVNELDAKGIAVQEDTNPALTGVQQLRFVGATVADAGSNIAEITVSLPDPADILTAAAAATTAALPGAVYTPGAATDGSGDTLEFTAGAVDGVVLGVGDRLLVKDEGSAANGVWVVDTVAATILCSRASDYRGAVSPQKIIGIIAGTANGDLYFAQNSPDTNPVQVGGPAGVATTWAVYPVVSGGTSYFARVPTDFATIQAAVDAGAREILLETVPFGAFTTIILGAQIVLPAEEEVTIYGPASRDEEQNQGGFPSFGGYLEIDATALGTTAAFLVGARGRLNLRNVYLYNNTADANLIEYADANSFFRAEGCNLDANVGNGTIVSSPNTGAFDNIYADFVGCMLNLNNGSTDYSAPTPLASLVVRGNPIDFFGAVSQDWKHFGLMVNTAVRNVTQYGHASAVGNQGSPDYAPTASRIDQSFITAFHILINSAPTDSFFVSDPDIDPANGGIQIFEPLIALEGVYVASQSGTGGNRASGCVFSIQCDSFGWGSAPYAIAGFSLSGFPINRGFNLDNCRINISERHLDGVGLAKVNYTNDLNFGYLNSCDIISVVETSGSNGQNRPLGCLMDFTSCQVEQSRFYQVQALFSDDLNRSSFFRGCVFDHCFVQDGGVGFSGTPAFDTEDGMELRECVFVTPRRIGGVSPTPPTNPGYMRFGGPLYGCRFNQIADEAQGWEGFIEQIRVEAISSALVDPGYGDFLPSVKDCMFGAGILEVRVYNVQAPLSTADWINQHVEVTDNVVHGDIYVGQATATALVATVQGNTQIGKTSSGADINGGSLIAALNLLVSARRAIIRGNSMYRPVAASPTLGTVIGGAFVFVASVAHNTAPTTTFIGAGTNDVFTDDPAAGTYAIAF